MLKSTSAFKIPIMLGSVGDTAIEGVVDSGVEITIISDRVYYSLKGNLLSLGMSGWIQLVGK